LWGYPSLHCKLRQIHIYVNTRIRNGNHTWYYAIATETHFKAMLWLSLWIPSNINYKPRKIRYGPLIKLKIMMDIEPIQARIIIMYNMSITRGNRECYTKIIWGSAYIHSICLYFSLKTSWIVSCIMVVSQAITHWKYNLPDNRFVTI
jgi:hypothetical protein